MSKGPRLRTAGRKARCSFCRKGLPRPEPREHSTISLLPGGRCSCGAVFVVDPTGRNGGVALLEALEDAAGGDRDKAYQMMRGRDYEELIENYDTKTHLYLPGYRGYRRGMARIYLIKLTEPEKPE